jgi:DNA-binding NarL/FixJ family response regulator
VVRKGLRALLESHQGWTVCAECKNGREAVDQAAALRPDVAVLDITMPELNGIEAARQIRKGAPGTKILLISTHYTDQLAREILAAGIRGYIVKTDPDADVVTGIECLIQNTPYFTPRAIMVLLSGFSGGETGSGTRSDAATSEGLTWREREIVQLFSEGKSSKEVAVQLNISVKTVDSHRANIMRKLNIHTVQELVRYAVRKKIIEP